MTDIADRLFNVPCWGVAVYSEDVGKRRIFNPHMSSRVARPEDPTTLGDLPAARHAVYGRLSDSQYIKLCAARNAVANEQPDIAANLSREVKLCSPAVALGTDLDSRAAE